MQKKPDVTIRYTTCIYLFPFFLGLILSFLGQLPLGTMSMTATQIAVQENFRNAWKYSVGVALIEMVYLRLVLSGMQWIMRSSFGFSYFQLDHDFIFSEYLAYLSFMAAQKAGERKKSPDSK